MAHPYAMTDAQWHRRDWHPFWRRLFGTWPYRAVDPAEVTPLPVARGVATEQVDPNLVRSVDTPLPGDLQGEDGWVTMPEAYRGYPAERYPGVPYQLGDSSLGTIPIRVVDVKNGIDYPTELPRPVDLGGRLFVESNPTPDHVMAQANMGLSGAHYDAHVQVYDLATDTYHECIGYNPAGPTVLGHGVHDRDGNLLEGRYTIWGKFTMGRYLWDADNDVTHALTLTVKGSDEAEPSWPWWNRRLTLSADAKSRIPEFAPGTPEANFVACVTRHPVRVGDHGGRNVFRYRALARALDRLDWQGWRLHMSDFIPADGLTGP